MVQGAVEFVLKNRLSELDKLQAHIKKIGRRFGQSRKNCLELSLVLEEILANIINYGYDDDREHQIRIAIAKNDNILTIQTMDDGLPFNPLEVKAPDCTSPAEDRPVGGLGIPLIRVYTDEITYERRAKRNILTIEKRSS